MSSWKALVDAALEEQAAQRDDAADSRPVTQELTGTEPMPDYTQRLHQQIDDLEWRQVEAASMRPGLLSRLAAFVRGSRSR